MSSILTNNGAMTALQTLKSINKNTADIQNQISTGKAISSAKDNAAVWAISKVMEADVTGFKAISDSLTLGESTVAVAKNASETVTDLLTQIKGKIVAAQEENVDRGKVQQDISALRDQIKTVVNSAQFNGLNMVKGTDDVNILSSLDRSADGTVTTSDITVARQDLTTGAGVWGGGNDISGRITIGGGATQAEAAGNSLALTLTHASLGGSNDITIGGTTISFAQGANATESTSNAMAAINALGLEGITASLTTDGSDGGLTIASTKSFEDVAVTSGAGIAGDGTIGMRAESVNLDTTTGVEAGDGYRISVGGTAFQYVAGSGETMEDVARGLKTAIDAGGLTGITTRVSQDTSTGQWSVKIDNSDPAAASLSVAGITGGQASGGLFGLDNINVTKDPEAALDNIETLIQNSIDAAASFGSVQNRIEIQNDFVGKLMDSMKSGIGAMVDADMEEASARLQALQVQQQLGVQSLSMANQAPQSLLSLFR
ncbi:flagellin N-terminal helical domain-containing protein [Roseitranquillus sediminis]|uniref:flagellin N-terminal helical domain-containing protein n=1 Tax=Roseitranquillus sediminis TaxID=2809051 RepID=UPI0029C9DA5E|nr:flagellin [Roseitranquillus sediminis]MBM9596113.1 flagellin [Roseitranquillus sediminis]